MAMALSLPALADAHAEEREAESGGRSDVFRASHILLGAHRGGLGLWPENTVLAFGKAAERWPEILLEGDLRQTSDGQVVLLHDGMVDRTTDGQGPIAGLTLEQVKRLDAGYRFTGDGGATFPSRGQGITIPTLAEALKAAPRHRFLFELKGGDTVVEETVKVLRKAGMADRTIIASFNPAHMARLRERAPEIRRCFSFTTAMTMLSHLRGGKWADYEPVDFMLSVSRGLERRFAITPEEIAAVRKKGILYQVHTVNRAEEMRGYIERGIDSILTDRPDLLKTVMDEVE